MQDANPASSRLHWKVLFFSVDVNLNFALVLVVGFAGVTVMVVFGEIVSTVQGLAFAGDLSMFPAGSVERT